MGTPVLAWSNIVVDATLTVGSAEVGLGADQLQTDQGSAATAWQTADGVKTQAGGAQLLIDLSASTSVQAFGLFRTNLTTSADVSLSLYSGVGGTGSLLSFTALDPPASGFGQVVAFLAAAVSARSAVVAIDDATNPDNHINVPLVFLGPAWRLANNLSASSADGKEDQTLNAVTRGGQEYPTHLWQRRAWQLQFWRITDAEMTNARALDQYARTGGNVLFMPDPDSAALQSEAVFGRLSAAPFSYPHNIKTVRAWSATIKERL